jgi:hypothetical protein
MFSTEYKRAYPDIINQYPKSNLGYTTNTKYPTFPPLMQDGRSVISSWNTEPTINKKICNDNAINNNWEYRKFLTKNALDIMKYNFNETANDTGNMFIPEQLQPTNNNVKNAPFLFKSSNEITTPFGYETSDLKETYLSREQLYLRKVVPTIV